MNICRALGWAASIIGAAIGAHAAGIGDAESFALLTALTAAFWGTEAGRPRCGGC